MGCFSFRRGFVFGAAAVLVNRGHADTDIFLPVDATALRLVASIDGKHSIAAIIQLLDASAGATLRKQARALFEQLWRHDQIVFDTSSQTVAR